MKTLVMALAFLMSTPAFAYIDAFPSFLNFSDTVVGRRSFMQTVTVSNRGQEDVSSIYVSPSCGIDFDVLGGSCYGTLRPNQSCSLNVTFSPTRVGYASCSIFISSSGGSASVSASGRGVKSPYLSTPKAKPREMPKKRTL